MVIKDTHKEALHIFQECQGVEAALQQQLVKVIDPIYLKVLHDLTTNLIILHIFDVLQYLYNTYGDIF